MRTFFSAPDLDATAIWIYITVVPCALHRLYMSCQRVSVGLHIMDTLSDMTGWYSLGWMLYKLIRFLTEIRAL